MYTPTNINKADTPADAPSKILLSVSKKLVDHKFAIHKYNKPPEIIPKKKILRTIL